VLVDVSTDDEERELKSGRLTVKVQAPIRQEGKPAHDHQDLWLPFAQQALSLWDGRHGLYQGARPAQDQFDGRMPGIRRALLGN